MNSTKKGIIVVVVQCLFVFLASYFTIPAIYLAGISALFTLLFFYFAFKSSKEGNKVASFLFLLLGIYNVASLFLGLSIFWDCRPGSVCPIS